MKIVGCDLHTRYQQVAMLEQETGEWIERRLRRVGGSTDRTIEIRPSRRAPYKALDSPRG